MAPWLIKLKHATGDIIAAWLVSACLKKETGVEGSLENGMTAAGDMAQEGTYVLTTRPHFPIIEGILIMTAVRPSMP